MKQVLRKDEDKDKEANDGLFSVHPSFNLIILTDMSNPESDDEILQMFLDATPKIEQFWKIYVKKDEASV